MRTDGGPPQARRSRRTRPAVLAGLGGSAVVAVALVVAMVVAYEPADESYRGPSTTRGEPVPSHRDIPVGLWAVANAPLQDAESAFAIRFVLDRPSTLYRFVSGFNLEGVYTDETGAPAPTAIRSEDRDKRKVDGRFTAPPELSDDWTPGRGRPGYGNGDGGTILARLVPVRADGTPDLDGVLGQDRVNAVQRYRESRDTFGVVGDTQLLYFDLGGVRLEAQRPYAVVYTNVAEDPRMDSFSVNAPVTKESVAGPNVRNTMDPTAPGAIAGLDPRESVSWSTDGGGSWVWGWEVGGGRAFGNSTASRTSDVGPMLPWYGWQAEPGGPVQSNQPYYAYGDSGSFTLVATDVPRDVVLREAGGYAPDGDEVGVVTVRNTRTGEEGRTAQLGEGMAYGPLDRPVPVAAGDTYEITNSGTVALAKADRFVVDTFGVGTGYWSFRTAGHGADRAELFALPHPWFVR